MKNIYTLADQIKDTIQVHGHAAAAKHYARKIPFTVYHFYAFGFLPRTIAKREATGIRVIRCML